ncbi:MAG: hypothetical protein U9Q34_01175, partial [Elusimicrobiota bacterium]|nr:hypothetical protein [Elusimicrobiota bacterium]
HYAGCSFSAKFRKCGKCLKSVQADQIIIANDRLLNSILKKVIFWENGKYLKAMLKRKQCFSGLFVGKSWSKL